MWIRCSGGRTSNKNYIFKDGQLNIGMTPQAYRPSGDSSAAASVGTITISGNELVLSKTVTTAGYCAYITDNIDLTDLSSISFYVNSATFTSLRFAVTNNITNNVFVATGTVNVLLGAGSVDVSGLTGNYKFLIYGHRSSGSTAEARLSEIRLN